MRQILTAAGMVPVGEAPQPGRRGLLKRLGAVLGGGLLGTVLAPSRAAAAVTSTSPYVGEIMIVPYHFAPAGWALCNGQVLSIAQNTALFSLLGNTFGGNGTTTFALPDLRGRVPVHAGQGPGLADYSLGQEGGYEQHTLLPAEMPAHSHGLYGSNAAGTTSSPSGAFLADSGTGNAQYYAGSGGVALDGRSVGTAGNTQPHNNMQPYLALNFCIALQGAFPSRA